MLPPGCTWISAHQTQRHIVPWCQAGEKQKGERKHLFQEATYKITMELCAGEEKPPPALISCSFILQEEDRKRKEEAQAGGSGRSILVSNKTAGLHLCYRLGSSFIPANLCPSANVVLQESDGIPNTTGNIQRKLLAGD